MTFVTSGIIEPQAILESFGIYRIGFSQASVGDGHHDDGRFQDFATDWRAELPAVAIEQYLRNLVRRVKAGAYNFMEFHGWPEIRHRDDGAVMVYSRLRLMHVQVVFQPRPN